MKTNEPTSHGDAQNMKSRQHHKSDSASHDSRPSVTGQLCRGSGLALPGRRNVTPAACQS